MTDAWSPYKQICVCGHDMSTHYRDPTTGERGACLGARCDECRSYRDHLKPTPPAPKPISTIPVPAPYVPPRTGPAQVGDRVRVSNPFSPNAGQEGEVISIIPGMFGEIARVRFDDTSEDWIALDGLQVI